MFVCKAGRDTGIGVGEAGSGEGSNAEDGRGRSGVRIVVGGCTVGVG